jgi:Na+/melibiose symporter-like transporter
MTERLRRRYGAHPAHLPAHLAVFAVAAWAVAQIVAGGSWINYLAWFVGGALLHDLVFLPGYSALGRGLEQARRLRRADRAAINYIRVPAAISGVLLLVYFPLIFGLSDRNYRNDTGHSAHGYLRNWLLITAGLFLASGLLYLLRRARRRNRAT